MARSRNRRKLLATAATFSIVGAASMGMTACDPNPATVVYGYTGAAQTYQVPANVCSVTLLAFGAQGGAGSGSAMTYWVPGAGGHVTFVFPDAGGLGAGAYSTVAVTPGETLQVNVGGRGDPGGSYDDSGIYSSPNAGVGGWNGGANGGTDSNQQTEAGGGGGASDVRRGGTSLADRVIVAGGGGGTGAGSGVSTPKPVGGVGGNPSTEGGPGSVLAVDTFGDGNGNYADPIPYGSGAGGGGGATTTAGGTGGSAGTEGTSVGTAGSPGALGVGGTGAASTLTGSMELGGFTGGGGGGGLYGGGGGGSQGYSSANGNRVVGAGGGGGSSLGDTIVAGLHQGDGQVNITPVEGSCGGSPTSTSTTTSVAAATKFSG